MGWEILSLSTISVVVSGIYQVECLHATVCDVSRGKEKAMLWRYGLETTVSSELRRNKSSVGSIKREGLLKRGKGKTKWMALCCVL